jgi:Ca-activated chloride channel family protein
MKTTTCFNTCLGAIGALLIGVPGVAGAQDRSPSLALEAPASVAVGEIFTVRWSAPVQPTDQITVVSRDAPHGATDGLTPVAEQGESLELYAPTQPGEYTIRLVTGERHATLAERRLEVSARDGQAVNPDTVPFSLIVPSQVAPAERFEVLIEGPEGEGDFLAVVADGETTLQNIVLVRENGRLYMTAPSEPGAYEVHYVAGKGRTMARARLFVQPAG